LNFPALFERPPFRVVSLFRGYPFPIRVNPCHPWLVSPLPRNPRFPRLISPHQCLFRVVSLLRRYPLPSGFNPCHPWLVQFPRLQRNPSNPRFNFPPFTQSQISFSGLAQVWFRAPPRQVIRGLIHSHPCHPWSAKFPPLPHNPRNPRLSIPIRVNPCHRWSEAPVSRFVNSCKFVQFVSPFRLSLFPVQLRCLL
jgi:hypothetical protein